MSSRSCNKVEGLKCAPSRIRTSFLTSHLTCAILLCGAKTVSMHAAETATTVILPKTRKPESATTKYQPASLCYRSAKWVMPFYCAV
jgi:hypothetical protein